MTDKPASRLAAEEIHRDVEGCTCYCHYQIGDCLKCEGKVRLTEAIILKHQPRWVSVKETPPIATDYNESDEVLIYSSLGVRFISFYCSGHPEQPEGWYIRNSSGGWTITSPPSYWQPLPEAPKEEPHVQE